MDWNTRNLLSWVVIAMMVMMPLRGVLALTHTTCDMHDPASQVMDDHRMHMMHQVNEFVSMDVAESLECCCCDSAMQCGSDCGIGINASCITQSVFTFPSLNTTTFHTFVNNNLVFRELAPPIRPPANLQI